MIVNVEFPAISPQSIDFEMLSGRTIQRSPHTGTSILIDNRMADRFAATLTFAPLRTVEESEALASFIIGLNGKMGTFLWRPPAAFMQNRPMIEVEVAKYGSSFPITRFDITKPVGFMVSSNNRLHMVSKGTAGEAYAWPQLKLGWQQLFTTTKKAVWRLADNSISYDVDYMMTYSFSIPIVEAQ